MNEVMGRKLEFLSFDLFRALLFNRCHGRCILGGNRDENWDEFFCSELVAECLQQLGIFREDSQVKSNLLIPSSFADPSDRKKVKHNGAFGVFDEELCLQGHDFSKSEVLIESGNEMYLALKEKKKHMWEIHKMLESKTSRKSYSKKKRIFPIITYLQRLN